jgi:NAD+ synthase (glutamine-hydrolysing)
MRIAMAQMNSYLGDFEGNRKKIMELIKAAQERRAELVLFPEASLFGYHPMDLLERSEVVEDQLKQLALLQKQMPKKIVAILGAITPNTYKTGKPYFNSAVMLSANKPMRVFPKQLLPAYDVFDEGRHIEPGREITKNIVSIKGKKVLVTVCEDIWAWDTLKKPHFSRYGKNPLVALKRGQVDLILNLSASPFTDKKKENRLKVTRATAAWFKAPLVYVNMVGAQDEIIFDGGSFAIDEKGKVLAQSVHFQEDLNLVDLKDKSGGFRPQIKSTIETQRQAIALGLRDFAKKTGMTSFVIGSSGGIDSAVTTCLAVDAVGPQNVTTVALPGPHSSPESLQLAQALAKNLGVRLLEMPIQNSYDTLLKVFDQSTAHKGFDLVNENLQARIRGLLLMAVSNFQKSLLLATSNKAELAMGYSTMYGDMNGAMMPIGDLLKTEVYELARHYNQERELIPEQIIQRAPSAELAPNQKDEDSLPPYAKLDPVVEKFVEGFSTPKGTLDRRVLKALFQSEFKRWQSPPVLKLSEHAFGMGRRLPIAHAALKNKL